VKKTVLKRLFAAAEAAQKHAYCPYSHFPVGASVMTEDGRIFAGCNVENASYGLGLCAERNAVTTAVGRGQRRIKAVAIVARLAKPCGACRQVLMEFSTKATELYLISQTPKRAVKKTTVFAMLPGAFNPQEAGLWTASVGGI
jgi:cytidine deaminase